MYSSMGTLIKKNSTKQRPINNNTMVTEKYDCGGAVARGKIQSLVTLKMETICTSETSAPLTRATRRHIPEDHIPHTYR
jgi:hypothetical protein